MTNQNRPKCLFFQLDLLYFAPFGVVLLPVSFLVGAHSYVVGFAFDEFVDDFGDAGGAFYVYDALVVEVFVVGDGYLVACYFFAGGFFPLDCNLRFCACNYVFTALQPDLYYAPVACACARNRL